MLLLHILSFYTLSQNLDFMLNLPFHLFKWCFHFFHSTFRLLTSFDLLYIQVQLHPSKWKNHNLFLPMCKSGHFQNLRPELWAMREVFKIMYPYPHGHFEAHSKLCDVAGVDLPTFSWRTTSDKNNEIQLNVKYINIIGSIEFNVIHILEEDM